MSNLVAIAGINIDSLPPIGLVGEHRIISSEDGIDSDEVRWFVSEGEDVLLNVLELTYQSVHQYLKKIYEMDSEGWDHASEKEGVSALMSLVGESASKMDAYFIYRFGTEMPKVEERRVFKELQEFYSKRFQKKFSGGLEEQKGRNLEFRDFETLVKDKEYELFYILDDRGQPYLSDRLLRNIKLKAEFDIETGAYEEDPYLQVKAMQDRDIQASANQILDQAREEIAYFYKIKKKIFGFEMAQNLSKAIFALYLSANSRHLIHKSTGKTCHDYFHDFQMFLREAMASCEYQKWIVYPPEENDRSTLMGLAHLLCYAFATRYCGIKEEAVGFIHRGIRKGGQLLPKEGLRKVQNQWSELLFEDEKLRTLLERFPGGPLLKTLDVIRQCQDEGSLISFDPWFQGNLPSKLFSIKGKKRKVDVLGFGAPIRQGKISQAEVINEFRGFLHYLEGAEKKHLLINFQDRLSWQESARAIALEELQESPSFSSSLMVFTLPKNTNFYHQRNEFQDLDDASKFKDVFINQIENAEESGFFFPKKWKKKELLKFTTHTIHEIHQSVFSNITSLTRQMREDFIELFYQLLIVEALNQFSFDSMSFTCKDGIDTGAYASALFFGFLTGYAGDLETKGRLDQLRYLFYWKALSTRERAPDAEQFFRILSCLELWNRSMEERGLCLSKVFPVRWVA